VKRPIPLKNIVNSNSSKLRQLTKNIQHIKQLNRRLTGILPASATQHCQIGSINDQTLILHCQSAAWATRIRFEQSKIIKAFRDLGIKSVSVHIQQPGNLVARRSLPPKREISPKSATLLQQLAENAGNDKLKAALRRLAQRAKQ